jgi:hypothetical protein
VKEVKMEHVARREIQAPRAFKGGMVATDAMGVMGRKGPPGHPVRLGHRVLLGETDVMAAKGPQGHADVMADRLGTMGTFKITVRPVALAIGILLQAGVRVAAAPVIVLSKLQTGTKSL